jgi:phage gp29-like protein
MAKKPTSAHPLARPVATRARSADGWAMADWLPNPDPVLKNLGIDIATYRDMRADAFVGGCIRRRRAAVKGLEQNLDRGQAPARVARAIEGILADLQATTDPDEPGAQAGLPALITEALDGALYGYQPFEVTWARVGALIVPQVIQGKPPEWFAFDADNQLRFKARDAGLAGERLPARKFLLARQDPSYLNPYGLADLSLCFWPYTFRKAARFWVAWLERYGGDFLIGKLPRSASPQEYDDLTASLEAMIQDSVAAIPDDGSVEVLASANKGGSSDAHERFLTYWRGEIAIALLGTNQSTEHTSTLASATAALDVADDLRDADARMVESVVNQLIRWTCAINWPSVAPPVWQLLEQEEIDTDRPTRDKILVEAGAKLTRAYWLRTYDLEEDDLAPEAELDPAAPAPAAPGQPPAPDQEAPDDDPTPAPALADPAPPVIDGQDIIDAELARDTRAAQQLAMERLLAPILTALADGLTPEEIMAHMDDWYGQLDDSLLQELLERGLAAADAIGRLEAQAEARV